MKFWSEMKKDVKTFCKTTDGKQWIAIISITLVIAIVLAYLSANPIVLSIRHDDYAYDNYAENRKSGYSFYTTESGTFYTTHGIYPGSIEVKYLLAPSEDLREAFDNGHITIEDLDRLGFDYWFMDKDK